MKLLSQRTKIAAAVIATSAAINLNLALPAAGQTYGKFSYYGTIEELAGFESGATIIPPGFDKGSYFSGEFYGAITDANPAIFGVKLNSEILNTSCCLSPFPSAFSGVLQADSSDPLIGRIYLSLLDSSYLDYNRQPIVGKSMRSYFSTGSTRAPVE